MMWSTSFARVLQRGRRSRQVYSSLARMSGLMRFHSGVAYRLMLVWVLACGWGRVGGCRTLSMSPGLLVLDDRSRHRVPSLSPRLGELSEGQLPGTDPITACVAVQ